MAIKRLFIITGDHSGDIHGANVVRALLRMNPDLHVAAVGGQALREAGAYLLNDQEGMGRVGLGAVTGAPYHIKLGQKILTFLKDFKPDGVLLIDYGGFNLWMAGRLKRRGHKVFYFIPPQVWASRRGRIQKIKATCHRVFCIFPFEEELYQGHGVPVTFVGHPLAGQLPPPASRAAFCATHGLDPERKILAVLPGSRKSELGFHMGPILEALPRLRASMPQGIPQVAIAQAGSVSTELLQGYLKRYESVLQGIDLHCIQGDTHGLLSVADCALVKSGTATLEAALYQTPMVIVYKVQPLVFAVGKRLCYVPCLGLPNILTDMQNPPVPELLQTDMTPERIAEALLPLLDPASTESIRQRQAFQQIQQALGRANAPEKVASEILQAL